MTTSDNIYCQTLTASRILQTNSSIISSSNLSNSTMYNSSNNSNNNSLQYYSIYYYFLPIDDRELDITSASIYAFTNDSSTFINWVNGNLTGLPLLLNISSVISIPFNINPSFSAISNFSLKVSDTWISISGLCLSSNGSIYTMIYGGNISNDTSPTYQQIMNNQKYDSNDGSGSAQIQYIFSVNSSSGYNFTGLTPNTSYIIVYFGTNDNPSYQDFLTTAIFKRNSTTLQRIVSSYGNWIKISGVFWIVLVILMNI